MDLDSISIDRASAISVDLGTKYLDGKHFLQTLRLRILHFMIVPATIRDNRSLDMETRQ